MVWDYAKIKDKGPPPSDFRKNFENWEFPEVPLNGITEYGWRVFGYNSTNPKLLKIGYGSDISAFTLIFAHNGIIIEPYVQIGPHSSIISRSTIDNKSGLVHLKRNCRIGAYSTVMPNVSIGQNSVIGAYSFVNKSIPENVLAAGIPCKIIKKI
jgi:acetyltransferase-like isoleucine patch superfamily enzyme